MRSCGMAACAILALGMPMGALSAQEPAQGEAAMAYVKVTPVLLADDVAACVAFWQALGFEAAITVPEGEGLGFAALQADGVELMYQSFSLAEAQDPAAVEGVRRNVLYIEVASLDDVLGALPEGTVIAVEERKTDYGTREIYVRDPAGHLIGFTQNLAAD